MVISIKKKFTYMLNNEIIYYFCSVIKGLKNERSYS